MAKEREQGGREKDGGRGSEGGKHIVEFTDEPDVIGSRMFKIESVFYVFFFASSFYVFFFSFSLFFLDEHSQQYF